MFLVISKDLSKYKDDKIYTVLNSICELKYLKGEFDLIIDNLKVNEEGIVEEVGIYLEEVLISLKINTIITKNPTLKLKEICTFYKIPILHNT